VSPLRRARRACRLAERERHALELHDNIVQGLVAIHWALEAADHDRARAATSATLAHAQQMIGGLLGDDSAFVPGSLRRAVATAPLAAAGPAAADDGH
jgi:signal transduction histidine kinase